MKVMLVDDSRAMRAIVRRTLREAGFEGLDIIEKANGREALEQIRAEAPELVLSDWNMPEMTGIELLDALKKEDIRINFGFVTSEGSPEILAEAVSKGALFLIVKPFSAEKFQTTLRKWIRG